MKSIIVVDDDDNIRQTILDILSFEDLNGVPFSGADGVVERLKDGDIGLVVTDLNMPGKDGIELISDIRTGLEAPSCDIPVILLTGAGFEAMEATALENGAFACLSKPFDIDKFIETIKAALGGENSQ